LERGVRRSGFGRLDDFIEKLQALDFFVRRGFGGRAVQMLRHRRIQRVVDERDLPERTRR